MNTPVDTKDHTLPGNAAPVAAQQVTAWQWAQVFRALWVAFKFCWFIGITLPYKIVQAGRPTPEQRRREEKRRANQRSQEEWERWHRE